MPIAPTAKTLKARDVSGDPHFGQRGVVSERMER